MRPARWILLSLSGRGEGEGSSAPGSHPLLSPLPQGRGAPFAARTTLILVRHGRTAWNDEARFQGQCDLPLDDVGREQSRRAAQRLAPGGPSTGPWAPTLSGPGWRPEGRSHSGSPHAAGAGPPRARFDFAHRPEPVEGESRGGADALYSSDLGRALESAEIIGRRLGLPVETCRALRERSYGAWEGLTRQEVEARFAQSWREWLASPQTHRPEGGEQMAQMTARVVACLERVVARHPRGRVVVVAHGGPIKSAVMHFLDLPMDHRRSFVIHNASLSMLSLGAQRPVLEALNDTCHLGPPGEEWAV